MNNNIKIFVKGQPKRNEGTKYLFAYPDAFNAMDGAKFAWATIITDPRTEIRDKFTNGVSGAYKLMHGPEGNYFSILFYSDVTKESALGITVVLEHGVPVDGKKMVALLNMLRERLPGNYRNEVVDECLAKCGMDKVGEVKLKGFVAPTTPSVAAIGYREYSSPQELEQLFTFHDQQAYLDYPGGILFVKAEDMPSSATFKRIDVPLVKHYRLPVSSATMQVKTAGGYAAEGQQVTVVFVKPNGCKAELSFVPEQQCDGVTYEGDVVRISAPSCLRFTARVALKVKCEGSELSKATVKMGLLSSERVMNHGPGGFALMLDEKDVLANPNVTITVEAPDCNPSKQKVTMTQLMNGLTVINVERKLKMMTLVVTIGGVTFRSSEMDEREIEKKKAALSRDGFEMRGSYNGKDIEVYKPTSKRQIPTQQHGSGEMEIEARSNRRGNWMLIAAVCAALLLVAGITWGLYKWLSGDNTPAQQAEIVQQEESPIISDSLSSDVDLQYMKRKNQWVRDSLKSTDAQALFDAIIGGKSSDIMNNPIVRNWKDDNSLNGYLLQLIKKIELDSDAVSRELQACFTKTGTSEIDWGYLKKEVIDKISEENVDNSDDDKHGSTGSWSSKFDDASKKQSQDKIVKNEEETQPDNAHTTESGNAK